MKIVDCLNCGNVCPLDRIRGAVKSGKCTYYLPQISVQDIAEIIGVNVRTAFRKSDDELIARMRQRGYILKIYGEKRKIYFGGKLNEN